MKPRPKQTQNQQQDALKNADEMRRQGDARRCKLRNDQTEQDSEQQQADANLNEAVSLGQAICYDSLLCGLDSMTFAE